MATPRLNLLGAGCRVLLFVALVGQAGCFRPSRLDDERALRLWDNRAAWPSAQLETGSQTLTLDEEQAIRLALRHSPELRTERSRVGVARARVEEERQLENPQLRLQNVEVDRMVDGELSLDLGVRLPIPKPWARDARIRRAEFEHQGMQDKAVDLERLIRGQVRKLFARLSMLERTGADLEAAIRRCARYGQLAEQSSRDGAITGLDASLTLVRRAELADLRHDLGQKKEQTAAELRRVIGLRPDRPVIFRAAEKKRPGLVLDEQTLLRRALTERRDLREAAAQEAMAEADAYRSRSERWPWLRFFDVYYRFRSALRPSNFELGLGVDLPLLSWNRGEIAKQDAQVVLRRTQEQALMLVVAQQVQAAVTRVRQTQARIQEMEQALLPSLESSARTVGEGASRSVVDPLRAINVEWRVVRAKQRYHQALLEHVEALVDLELALGG